MPKKASAIVLDSWAAIAYLEDEPAGARVADIIADAHEGGVPVLMSVINSGEIWSIIAREASEEDAERDLDVLRGLGIEIVDATWDLTRRAASFKSKNKMSYADCFHLGVLVRIFDAIALRIF